RRPAIAHFAVLATFLVPFTLAPYLLMRQRVRGLHKRLDDLAATTSSLQKNMDKAVVARNLIKVELGRNAAQMEIYQKESKHLHRELERLRTEQTASKAVLQSNLQKLLEERKATRQAESLSVNYLAVLPQLGLSLADIAAFMHEVELYQGLPSTPVNDHGVERLRMLALKLQKSS
ncbi:hypothetical protein BV22DRAFT_972131, partial [Leucogyrophana mollusca]